MAVAALGLAIQLRQRDHRNIQLARDGLNAAADLTDLLLATFRSGVIHQLHVVDHQHLDVVLKLQPPRFRAQFQDREPRRVIDPDRRLGELVHGHRQMMKLLALEQSFADFLRVDLRAAAHQALRELLLAHFQ